eukprot:8684278-Pyramimonas_sp.AAC.1
MNPTQRVVTLPMCNHPCGEGYMVQCMLSMACRVDYLVTAVWHNLRVLATWCKLSGVIYVAQAMLYNLCGVRRVL